MCIPTDFLRFGGSTLCSFAVLGTVRAAVCPLARVGQCRGSRAHPAQREARLMPCLPCRTTRAHGGLLSAPAACGGRIGPRDFVPEAWVSPPSGLRGQRGPHLVRYRVSF